MATQYLSRVLKGFDNVFGFRSSQKGAPLDVELDLPIQPVADIMRLAAYGSGIGPNSGWWHASVQNVHTVTGAISTNLVPYNPTNFSNGYPASYDVDDLMAWAYGFWGEAASASDFSNAKWAAIMGSTSIGPSTALFSAVRQVVQRFDSAESFASGPVGLVSINEPSNVQPFRPFPLLARAGDVTVPSWFWTSSADNAGTETITGAVLFWLGAKFAPPPGV